jgi:hypothetical protein
MVSTISKKAKALQASLIRKKKHKKWVTALIAATAITSHMAPSLFPTPMNTSVLTGMAWLRELLTGHPVRFYDALGMPKHVFRKLVHELELHAGLKHSKHICAEEQVALCMICGSIFSTALTHYQSESPYFVLYLKTDIYISRIFHRILDMVVSGPFYNHYVKLPPKDQTPPEIRDNPKLYPFFMDCRGVIDGTHIDVFVLDDVVP